MCFNITRCWSYVGQVQINGGQPISIGSGCGFIETVLHEIMHALGFFHTNSRYDRDSYVTVKEDNIMQGKQVAFSVFEAKTNIKQHLTDLFGGLSIRRTS